MFKWPTLVLLFAACLPLSNAQMAPSTMLSWGRSPLGAPGASANRSVAMAMHPRGAFRGGRTLIFGDPFFYQEELPVSLAYDIPSASADLQTRPLTAPEPTAEPLLIEWRGDRFVRTGGGPSSESEADYSEAAQTQSVPGSRSQSPVAEREISPVVLVYRDGRRKEVSDYVITGGALYARSDYPTTGVWTETIQLSALDLPATVSLNQASGVKFVLPSGPYEVITRP